MRNTFLELETHPTISSAYCFVGIDFCSADYLSGVEKAADNVRRLSYRYANADGSSLPLKVYSPEEGCILKDTSVYDYGNIKAESLEELWDKLQTADIPTTVTPIFVGSDHSISYNTVKLMEKRSKSIVVVQFDAHSDFIDEYESYPHGSVMNETSKLKHVERIIHFGLRGNLNSEIALKETVEKGNMVVRYNRISEYFFSILDYIKDKDVYITFDTDFLNPKEAPATNCAEPGGPNYEQTLVYLREIIKTAKRVVGVDFVEYNPNCEGANMTGTLIVNLVMETLSYMTKYKTSKT